MSQRHINLERAPLERVQIRAKFHSERQRVSSSLRDIAESCRGGIDADDLDDPGNAFHRPHHHDASRGRERVKRRRKRHWKTKMWKRRTTVRRAKARQLHAA
jgi:hypothetical protein